MQEKVQNYIEKHQLLTHNKTVIVGISGGADSVVLLHLLLALGYNCVVAHCNFHLRMAESDSDELFVRELSQLLKIPFYQVDFKTSEYAKKQHISIEMAARDLRYAWFHELLQKTDSQAIAVAHHADDSIETLLMNLVRGTGLRGLTGIAARNEKVVRPLLCCTREEIENYCVEHGLEYVTDSTNATLDYRRNKFRNVVLPLLEEINPAVRQTLYDSVERFKGALAIYEQAISQMSSEMVDKTSDDVKIDIEQLKKQLHLPTVLYELLHPYGYKASVIEQIIEQLDGESGKLFYSDTHRLLKDRKHLILTAKDAVSNFQYWISQDKTDISQPFQLKIKALKIDSSFRISKEKNRIHLDASRLHYPLQIRRWQEGDSFFPFGMSQRKKISDFFIDNKFTLIEKEQAWLLLSNEEVVWIVGQRTDNRYRVTEKTSTVIEMEI